MRGSTAGITDGLQGQSKAYYILLYFLDVLIGTMFITPLVITYWRGTWGLFETYVFPDKPMASALVSVWIGFGFLFIFNLLQKKIKETLNPDIHRLVFYLLSRLYTKLFSIACVNSWRGIWRILDIILGTKNTTITALSVLFAFVLLIPMKTLRNLSAPPFAIVTDRYKGYFEVPTLFHARASQNMCLYIMDSFLSVFVIGSLVVFVWRGMWGLVDIYLYREELELSAAASLIVGYTLVFSTFLLQPVVKRLVGKISGFWRVFAVDVYLLFSLCGTINVWRGIWVTLDCYFLKDNKVVGFWLSHFACFLILVLINSSNSILVRGVYTDAEEDGGKCVDFPCYYLRLFFQSQRRKMILKQSQKKQEFSNLVRQKSGDHKTNCEKLTVPNNNMEPIVNNFLLHQKRDSIRMSTSQASGKKDTMV